MFKMINLDGFIFDRGEEDIIKPKEIQNNVSVDVSVTPENVYRFSQLAYGLRGPDVYGPDAMINEGTGAYTYPTNK